MEGVRSIFGLTRNLELYSRHRTYLVFLLGPSAVSSATSWVHIYLLSRTALPFHLQPELLHWRPVLPMTVSHRFVFCSCLAQLLQRSYYFKIAEFFICLQSYLWSVVTEFPEKLVIFSWFFFFFLQEKTKHNSSWWREEKKKKSFFSCKDIKACCTSCFQLCCCKLL